MGMLNSAFEVYRSNPSRFLLPTWFSRYSIFLFLLLSTEKSKTPNIMPCRECGCKRFVPNPVSAIQKLVSGGDVTVGGSVPVKGGAQVQASCRIAGQPTIDNKSDQAAYRNCLCGHHWNYH